MKRKINNLVSIWGSTKFVNKHKNFCFWLNFRFKHIHVVSNKQQLSFMINILKSYQYTGRPLVYIELWRIPTNTSMHTSALIKKDFSYKRSLTHKVSITPKGSNSFIIKSLLFIRIIMHFAGLFKSKQPNYSKLSIFKQKTKLCMFKCLLSAQLIILLNLSV